MSSDILTQFADRLRDAGIVVERIEADGILHRYGVSDKPKSKDGAYRAHLDEPASIWWRNWHSGDEGTWSAKSDKTMTADEREVLKARIAEAKDRASRVAVSPVGGGALP